MYPLGLKKVLELIMVSGSSAVNFGKVSLIRHYVIPFTNPDSSFWLPPKPFL